MSRRVMIGRDGGAAKGRNIGSSRQLDDDRFRGAGLGVVLVQRPAQPARHHAHDRVGLRIEIAGAAERLHRDRIALDLLAVAAQGRFDHESEERGPLG
jgi:hypothetical protein